MTISVIIPAHNEEKLIGQTIAAIHVGLLRTGRDYEIIVVNDDSTDQTAAVSQAAKAKVVDVQLRNIGAVRNAGAKRAVGDNLFFVDADTIVPESTWLAALRALDSGASGGGARVRLNDAKGIPIHKYWLFPCVSTIWQSIGGWAAGCFMFCRTDSFSEFGGFPEEYFAAEEYFFSRALKRLGRFDLVREPVFTSARKLRDYSLLQLLRFVTVPFITTSGALKSRRGLEVLYEHKRDG